MVEWEVSSMGGGLGTRYKGVPRYGGFIDDGRRHVDDDRH